ncbi:hypothetical protein B0H34DRAFT_676901 [Crassisporium funariophilum]|nr:hypothetical protein B0H34DRAFT_676901 [Crassisporium funariophilum]
MSVDNRLQLFPSIKAGLLFAHQMANVKTSYISHCHLIFEAIRLGVDYPFTSEFEDVEDADTAPVKLMDIFRTHLDALLLLKTMYKARVIQNSVDLLPYIKTVDVEPGADDPVVDHPAQQIQFLTLLHHYLGGKGHPQGAL